MAFDLSSVLMKLGAVSTSDHASVVSLNICVALLCACIVIGHLLEENRWMNESITALAIGLCTGVVIMLTSGGRSSHILVFSEDLFFIYLLPPIIFNAGFQVKKKQFFRNFMTIMLFGAVGTLISSGIISVTAMFLFKRLQIAPLDIGDYLAIGAIFSATDSVCTLQVLNQDETPLLYSLVFGEGVVNDATSVVLFNAIQRFDLTHINSGIALKFVGNFFSLFILSTLLGVGTGLLSAYIIKKLYFGRHSTDREVALMILMAYLSYMLAELFTLSAILTVFFCGIVMSHYTWHNVTESSRITTKHAFATLSFIAEIFIFLYVGMDALDIEKWSFVSSSPGKSIGVSSILLALVLVGRAAFVFPLSFLSNLTKKTPSDKISFKQQVTIWWAGLMRGAVSMALAYNQPGGAHLMNGPDDICTPWWAPQMYWKVYMGVIPLLLFPVLWTTVAPDEWGSCGPHTTLLVLNMLMFRNSSGDFTVAKEAPRSIKQFCGDISFVRTAFKGCGAVTYLDCPSVPHYYWQFTRSGHTQLPGNAIMITSTITVVLFSTVVFGLMTKPLIRLLLPQSKHTSSMLSSEPSSPKSFLFPLLGNGQDSEGIRDIPRPTSLRMLLSTPTHTVHHYWRKFDNAVMRPMFGGRGFTPYVPGSPTEPSVNPW